MYQYLPDLLSVQRESFFNFLREGLLKEINYGVKSFKCKGEDSTKHHCAKIKLKKPRYTPEKALRYSCTYESEIFIPVEFKTYTNVYDNHHSHNAGVYADNTKTSYTSATSGVHKVKQNDVFQCKWIPLHWPSNALLSTSLQSESAYTIGYISIGKLPLLTNEGSFIINGAKRVLMNQIVRSPGIYYKMQFRSRNHRTYTISYVSDRGVWLRIERDKYDYIWVRINNYHKIPLFVFLRSLGITDEILSYTIPDIHPSSSIWQSLKIGNPANRKRALQYLGWVFRKGKKPLSVQQTREFLNEKLFNPRYYSFTSAGRISINHKCNNVFRHSTLSPEDILLGLSALDKLQSGEIDVDDIDHLKNKRVRLVHEVLQNQIRRGFKRLEEDLSALPLAQSSLSQKKYTKSGMLAMNSGMLAMNSGNSGIYRNRKASLKYTLHGKHTCANRKLHCFSLREDTYVKPNFSIFSLGTYTNSLGSSTPDDSRSKRKYISHSHQSKACIQNANLIIEKGKTLCKGKCASNRRMQKANEAHGTQYSIQTHDEKHESTSLCFLHSCVCIPLTSRRVKAEENETHDTQIQTGAKHNIWQFGIPSVTSVAVQKSFDRPYWVKYTNAKYDTQISSYFSKFQKSISNTLKEFFALNPLSQFMDEINPLAQLTQKRRLTSLGPGGVTREAGLAVRDIHPSYYGRICPIETPEGKNAGLVNSLSTHCRINTFGFLQTPYVQYGHHPACNEESQHENWPLVRQFTWLTSEQEQNFYIVAIQNTGMHNAFNQGGGGYTPTGYTSTKYASTGYTPTGYHGVPISSFATQSNGIASDDEIDTRVTCRYNQCVLNLPSSFIDFSSVSTISIISVATSLIPFLEHDDGNRALMGSNMQRQGVPLFTSEKAIVGTGIEGQSARDCRSTIRSEVAGKVSFADCGTIEICHTNYTRYNLPLFQRTNQNTLLSATPRVYQGEYVRRGDLLADTSCTNMGELSIGKNLYLGYMPWEGYNFEDAIVITEGVEDSLTSVHVQKVKVSTDNDEEFSPPRFTSHGEDNGNQNLSVASIKDFVSKIPIMPSLPMKVCLPLVQDSVFGTGNERTNWCDYNTIHTQCTVNEVVRLLYEYQNIGYNEDSVRLHLNS